MMADQKDKELEQERKELQSELNHELDKSKDIDEKKPFDWLIHMMKSFLLTFQLMFLPQSDKDKKEEDKQESFEKEDPTVEEDTNTELSDSKMLKGLGAQPKPSPPKPVPVIPINPLEDPEEDKDEEEEEMDQNDKFDTPFAMNPLSTKLQRKK